MGRCAQVVPVGAESLLLWLFMYAGDRPMVSVDFLTRPIETVDLEDATRMFDTLLAAKKRIAGLLPFGSEIPRGLAHHIRKGGRTFSVETDVRHLADERERGSSGKDSQR